MAKSEKSPAAANSSETPRKLSILLIAEPSRRGYLRTLLQRMPYKYAVARPFIKEMDSLESAKKEFAKPGSHYDFIIAREDWGSASAWAYGRAFETPDGESDPPVYIVSKIYEDVGDEERFYSNMHLVRLDKVLPRTDRNFIAQVAEDLGLRKRVTPPDARFRLHALVVDDNPENLIATSETVLDFAVRRGMDPADVSVTSIEYLSLRDRTVPLEKLSQSFRLNPPNVVILDSDNDDLIPKIRSLEGWRWWRRVPIIVLYHQGVGSLPAFRGAALVVNKDPIYRDEPPLSTFIAAISEVLPEPTSHRSRAGYSHAESRLAKVAT